MAQSSIYKFRCRPEYGSGNLLIEFISGVENETFETDFFNTIKEINPKPDKLEDVWMNDEFVYSINSDFGFFTLSKDIWDLAYLISDGNQSCIAIINDLLIDDKRFEKLA
jgi:hypothetical protein